MQAAAAACAGAPLLPPTVQKASRPPAVLPGGHTVQFQFISPEPSLKALPLAVTAWLGGQGGWGRAQDGDGGEWIRGLAGPVSWPVWATWNALSRE